ncbi:MAG: hypothetical protein ACLTSG_00005 [Lachnospiraceae bacterium]
MTPWSCRPWATRAELLQKSEDSVGPYILQDFFFLTAHGHVCGGS